MGRSMTIPSASAIKLCVYRAPERAARTDGGQMAGDWAEPQCARASRKSVRWAESDWARSCGDVTASYKFGKIRTRTSRRRGTVVPPVPRKRVFR